MSTKPVLLMAFAANDLSAVHQEAQATWQFVAEHPGIQALKIESVDIDTLTEAIIDHQDDLYFFHFSGHASKSGLILDENRALGKYHLSRLLTSGAKHPLHWAFLNGCESYGQVGILTASGVKAVMATNNKVNDKDAAKLARFFYKCFFQKKFTLKAAFEKATATLPRLLSQTLITNPGEINEEAPLSANWALYIHSQHQEVLNWTLADFLQNGAQETAAEAPSPSGGITVTGSGNTIISGVSGSQLNLHTGQTSPPNPAHPKHAEVLAKIDNDDLVGAFKLLDQVNWGNFRGSYIQLKNEFVDIPQGGNRMNLRERLKVFIGMRMP